MYNLLAQADSDAFKARYYVVQFLVLIVLLAGILKCYSIAKRPTASRKCVFGLMLVLTAWFCWGLMASLKSDLHPAPWLGIALGLLLTLGGLAVVVGATLSVIGLLEYKRHPEFRQGQWQAIAALLSAAVVAVCFTVGFITGYGDARAQKFPAGTPLNADEKLIFDELNFTFTAPGKPWVKLDAGKVNKAATLVLMRTLPQMFFMVIAEKSNPDLADSARLTEVSKGNLASRSARVSMTGEVAHKRNGMDGVRFYSDVEIAGLQMSLAHWVSVRNGYAYQLIVYGPQTDRATIRTEAEDLFSRFRQIDPERIAQVGEQSDGK